MKWSILRVNSPAKMNTPYDFFNSTALSSPFLPKIPHFDTHCLIKPLTFEFATPVQVPQ